MEAFHDSSSDSDHSGSSECGGIFAAPAGAGGFDFADMFPYFWEQTIMELIGGTHGNGKS